ncbi:hypothetical protein BN903_116 [Halorubrum sp. AJ67]|nr:hypothetical protein BN903_116 [Halorubrum sp. AJ67]
MRGGIRRCLPSLRDYRTITNQPAVRNSALYRRSVLVRLP